MGRVSIGIVYTILIFINMKTLLGTFVMTVGLISSRYTVVLFRSPLDVQ